FIWGRDVSGTWDGAGGIGGLVAIEEEGGRRLLVVDDGLGNITALINQANGETVAKFDYTPYGELKVSSGDVNACPFRYQSKYYDAETGLSYFGFRYYSAKLGRWISRDPLGEEGGFNLYGYCGNDPVNRWDYLGMDSNWNLPDAMNTPIARAASRSMGTPQMMMIKWFKWWREGEIGKIDAQITAGNLSREDKMRLQVGKSNLLALGDTFRHLDNTVEVVSSPASVAALLDTTADGPYQLGANGGFLPAVLLKNVAGVDNIKVLQFAGAYDEGSLEDYTGQIGAVFLPVPPVANSVKPMVRGTVVVENWSQRMVQVLTKQRSWLSLSRPTGNRIASSGNNLPAILTEPLVAGQHTLDAAISSHPALNNVRFSAAPQFDASLPDFGLATRYTAIDGDISIGYMAFQNNMELIGTLVHEEAHLRFFRRMKLSGPKSRTARIGWDGEEDYVRAVEARFIKAKGLICE
ncbi:RHS repeat-associated core domain-containing protein, partial [Verrucomicrobium sp. BvORR034]|uniref:RHS repeat-associated core domain-containing protein n=1 Tax=Verrucomicrobium sp. BvORR034 TaxID=1396418 RepID=UPI002240FDDA